MCIYMELTLAINKPCRVCRIYYFPHIIDYFTFMFSTHLEIFSKKC
jgi:hypothetical protein